MPRPESKDGKFYVSSAAEVAQVYGVTPDTVKQWRSRGMPGDPRRYVLEDIARWLRSDGPWSSRAPQLKTDDPLLEEGDSPGLERYRMAKAQHAELDLDARRGELIEREKCRDILSRWATSIRRMSERIQKRYGQGAATEIETTLMECELIVRESLDGND